MLKSKGRSWLLAIVSIFIASTAFAQEFTISGGGRFSISVCADGSVYTWGSNVAGQLGTGAGGNVNTPTTNKVVFPTAGLSILQADGGSGAHALALDCNKNVWAWGLNCDGQVGNGSGGRTVAQVQANNTCGIANNVYTPIKVLKGEQTATHGGTASTFLEDVKFISGGNVTSYAIVGPNRALMAWGSNVGVRYDPGPVEWLVAGLLGNNNATIPFSNTPVFVRKCDGTILTGVVSVDASDVSAVALTDDGGVYSWGLNTNSSLGIGLDFGGQKFSACATPVKINATTALTNIVEVTGGDQHFIAVDGAGNAWSWGGGWAGQLGQAGTGNSNYAARILAGTSGTVTGNTTNLVNVTAVSASQIGSAAVVTTPTNGYLYTFGGCGTYQEGGDASTANLGGQLGINSPANCMVAGTYTPGLVTNAPTLVPTFYDGATAIPAASVNVIGVSDGDGVFYVITQNKTTLVKKIYAMGANNLGQLGLGDNIGRMVPTLITTCPIADPCPVAILPADFEVCPEGISQLLTATDNPALTYVYQWQLDGTNIPGATNRTYTATALGTYSVTITRTGGGCTTCPIATDAVTITAVTANFADPGDLTFCGTTATVNVTESGSSLTTTGSSYEWYAAQTGGTALATTTDDGTASLNVTTLTKTGTAPNRIAEVWVEDKSTFTTSLAPKASIAPSGQQNYGPTRINFSPLKDFKLNSVQVEWVTYSATTVTLTLYNSGGTALATGTSTPIPFTSGPQANTSTVTFTTTPTLTAGSSYYIVSSEQTRQYDNPGSAYTTNYAYLGVNILDILSSASPGVTNLLAPFFNWNVTVGSPYPCGRLKVLITEDCPPCSKPSTVTITTPATTPVTICQGTAQNLIGSVTVPAAAQNTNFYYSWRKTLPAASTPVAPTVIAIPASTPTATPALALTGALTDAGTYVLRVEDGNAGSATCYTEATVVVVVNPTTVPGVIAAAQTICTGGNPAAFTVTTPASGGNGTTYAYQWERSIDGAAYANIAGATNATFDEAALTNATALPVTYDYRRKVTSGVCPEETSNAVRITVNPAVVPGVVAGNQTICSAGDPAAFTQTTGATGGSGTYTYQWQSSTTSASAGFADITGATNATYDAPTGLTTTTYYRRVDASGTCTVANTNAITVTVTPSVLPGTVTANQTICYNTVPAAFTSTAAATGGTGTYAYQWQQSTTSGGVFTNIAGETNATYTPTVALTADRYYRRQVTSGTVAPCNVANTAEIRITVSPDFVVGSIGGTQTVCQTGDPTVLTSVTLPTGGQTAYTYQWQSSTAAGGPYTNIPSATNATYDPPTGIAATTYFIRVDRSAGGCGTLNTNEVTVTVTPTVVPSVAIATPSTTICAGESITFTATPTNGGTPTYQWRRNGSPIAAATNATYTTTTAADGDIYTVVMTSTANCASPATATSNAITMTVTTVVTPAVSITAAPGNTICAGTSVTFTASPGNGGTTPAYQWYRGAIPGTAIASATNATYTTTTAANGDSYYVIMTSNSGCVVAPGTATSNVITMTVNPIPTPDVAITVAPGNTICAGTSLTFTAAPTQGGTTPTYVWSRNGTPIVPAATNATYTTTTAANNDSYTVSMVSNALCAPATAVTSAPIVITVNPILVPAVTISASPTTICTNGSTTFTAVPTNGGAGPMYQWYINGTPEGAASSSATFTTTALTSSSDNVEVRLLSNALCADPLIASASMSVTVNTGIGAGTVGSDQTICYNTIPAAITQTAAPTSIVGTPTYQWEQSLTGSAPFTAIPGATNSSYTPTAAITTDVYVRRVITDPGTPAPCNVATSNAVHITVRPQLVAGVIGSDETICSGAVPAAMTQTTAPTGGTGTYTYQWQSSTALAGPYTDIPLATNAIYAPGALTVPTYYQRVETSGTCGSVTSNIVTKDISAPEAYTVSINDPGVTCTGPGSSITFTATATATTPVTGTLSYEWFMNSTSVGTGPTYVYSPVVIGDDNKVVRLVVTTTNGCSTAPWTSNLVTLDIVDASTPTVTITTLNNPNCAGLMSTFTATSTGGGNNPTYQWFVNGSPVPAATNVTFSSSTLANGDQVYAELTSSLPCLIGTNPFPSNVITMVIKPIPAPAIAEGDQTICSPNTFTFTGVVTAGNTYEWRELTSNTVVGTGPNFPATQSGTYALFEDNGTCNSTSQPVVLNVVQTPVANAGADIYIRQGDMGNLNGSGGAIYSWSPSTYLDDATRSNPNFRATETIMYTLTVSDASNTCSTTDDVNVFVVKPIVVPNVITVNGDGTNDDWEIENIEGYPNVIIEIYNRWGNLVWKSEGYPKNWDGTNFRNGQVLPDGTYFYIINLQSQIYDEPLTGWVQVMK